MDIGDKEVVVCATTLSGKLDLLSLKLDELKERQEDMAADVSKVKEAVYHPDDGLYARLRELESAQKTATRFTWMLVSSTLGILAFLITRALS